MARYIGPKHKLCRREGKPICGIPEKCPVVKRNAAPPGQHGSKRVRRQSDYGVRLREKQKTKRIYGVLERQFRRYYQRSAKHLGVTGEELLKLLERRLDNVVYRLRFAQTRPMARQLVVHGHVRIDDQRVDRPSYLVKEGQVVSLGSKAIETPVVKTLLQESPPLPSWLERRAALGKVLRFPKREEIQEEIDESLIVEFYSR